MPFDYRTHVLDKKGKVAHRQDYIIKIEGGMKTIEQPIGSGVWYHEDGSLTEESAAKMNSKADQTVEDLVKEAKEKTAQEQALDAQKKAADVANGHSAPSYESSKAEAQKPVEPAQKPGADTSKQSDSKK